MEEHCRDRKNPLRTAKAEEEDRLIIRLFRFWSFIDTERLKITEKAINTLLTFSTTYLCELGFSALTDIKKKKRKPIFTIKYDCVYRQSFLELNCCKNDVERAFRNKTVCI